MYIIEEPQNHMKLHKDWIDYPYLKVLDNNLVMEVLLDIIIWKINNTWVDLFQCKKISKKKLKICYKVNINKRVQLLEIQILLMVIKWIWLVHSMQIGIIWVKNSTIE